MFFFFFFFFFVCADVIAQYYSGCKDVNSKPYCSDVIELKLAKMSIAYDHCTDVLCIVDAQMLLSILLGIDAVMPSEYMSLLA